MFRLRPWTSPRQPAAGSPDTKRSVQIEPHHIEEAILYRMLDRDIFA
ncbi:MAG: hypothetical protein ACKN85_04145 [Pirellula sp.]